MEARLVLSSVSAVYPEAFAIDAPSESVILAAYDEPLAPETVSAATFTVYGSQSGRRLVAPDRLDVRGRTIVFDPTLPFRPGELVRVTATNGIRSLSANQTGEPYVWDFRVGTRGGSGYFGDRGQKIGAPHFEDIALGDLDGDGDLDAFAATPHAVWLNDGNGTFHDSGQILADVEGAVELGDVDGDGDLDALVGNDASKSLSSIWLNDGHGNFVVSVQEGRLRAEDLSLGDLDGDGDLDVVAGFNGQRIWLNNGEGQFTFHGNLGRSSGAVALGDVDADGDLDAFVAGDTIWLNNGQAVFEDSGQQLGGTSSDAVALGDLDGDGDLDAFLASRFSTVNTVWVNNGSGFFRESGQRLSNTGDGSVVLGDLDGDGDLDAFTGSRYPEPNTNKVWLNDGQGHFHDSGQTFGDTSVEAVELGDLDGDGDLDAVGATRLVTASEPTNVWFNGDVAADLSVTINDNQLAVVPGQRINYTISVTNDGPEEVADATVSVPVPPELTSVRWDCIATVGSSCGVDGDGDIKDNISLLVGGRAVYTIDVSVNQDASGPVTFVASATVGGALSDIRPLNSTASDTNVLLPLRATPEPNSHISLPDDAITVTFDAPIDPATVSADSLVIHGTLSGRMNVSRDQFVVEGNTISLVPSRKLHPGELVQVTASADIETTHGVESRPFVWQFRVGVSDSSGFFLNSGRSLGVTPISDIALGDLDSDGDVDAVAFGGTDSNFERFPNRIMLNNGQGEFTDIGQVLDTSSRGELGDLDGDADLDLITVDGQAWYNDGNGLYRDVGQVIGEDSIRFLRLADLDGDGDLDAFVRPGQTYSPRPMQVWLNDGQGQFDDTGQRIEDFSVRDAAIGDLDGDGDLDVLVVHRLFPAKDTVFLNDGTGIFTDSGWGLGEAESHLVELGDLDGDGDLDAFLINFFHRNQVWLNDGSGRFHDSGQRMGLGRGGRPLELGDVDGDGDLDALSDQRIWLNDGHGFFRATGQELGTSRVWKLADLDGDGDLDAVAGAQMWENADASYPVTFVDSGQELGESDSWAVELGDLDGDGDLDAFVANAPRSGEQRQSNRVWLNDSSGRFTDSGQSIGNADSTDVALGDLDGDGDLDAFVTNSSPSPDELWLNDGNGQFSDSGQRIGRTVPRLGGYYTSYSVALGDLDGDGDLDALISAEPAVVTVWFNDGDGNFSDSGQSFGSTTMAILKDTDGDGDLDAVMPDDSVRNTEATWLNDGSGRFTKSDQRLDDNALNILLNRFAASGDMNGDAHADAIVPISLISDGGVWVLLNGGGGVFTRSQHIELNYPAVALGDLDGDGDIDVYFASRGSTSDAGAPNRVWFNTKPSIPIVTGDANDDGRFDQFDIVKVLQAAKYLTGEPATWAEGDWNDDGVFSQDDIVIALLFGRYR